MRLGAVPLQGGRGVGRFLKREVAVRCKISLLIRKVADVVLLFGAVTLIALDTAGVAQAGDEVPEMSPAAIGGALTLLAGGALLLRERFRSR